MTYFSTVISLTCFGQCPPASCTNQTDVTRPEPGDALPYTISVEKADFCLPVGIQSFAFAVYNNEWLFISGRTEGLHDVNAETDESNSFPPKDQNRVVYVVDPIKKKSYSRSLNDPCAKLSQKQIDLLSVTNSLYSQTDDGKTLYLVGGYGINTKQTKIMKKEVMETKQSLTAIDVRKLIAWVKRDPCSRYARDCFRFTDHPYPVLQLAGGKMVKGDTHGTYLLAFGQNFDGLYTIFTNGDYSMQVRKIEIEDNGCKLCVREPGRQPAAIPEYRRRDLNVVPIVRKDGKCLKMSYVALSGVFTPQMVANPGAWTIPIEIEEDGSSHMLDPDDPKTLKQAMNNYDCATVGLYSKRKDSMYTLLFGGISASIISKQQLPDCTKNCTALISEEGDEFITCCNLPFSNDITTIEINKERAYKQYLTSKFPEIKVRNPERFFCKGDPLPSDSERIFYFGSDAVFIPDPCLPAYENGVIEFDELKHGETFLGYIVGGIASTILDTNCVKATIASPYIFEVYITPKRK